MNKTANLVIIFGITGDLANRKLIPAINGLVSSDSLPGNTYIIGGGRKNISNYKFDNIHKNLKDNCLYLKIDPNEKEDFKLLKYEIDKKYDKYDSLNIIYYLSIPPSAYSILIKNLVHYKLNTELNGFRRVIVEKPFGENKKSSIDLNKTLRGGFNEDQIYRIDHYLGKETVQNILISRFSNIIFNSLWNKNHISYIEITAAERIGIERRGEYYEKAGAIKDMFQNHLLELLCLIAMEEPKKNTAESIRNEKIKLLDNIRKINYEKDIVRGQYTRSENKIKKFKGYRDNMGVDKESMVETFFACKLFIDNERWKDIPFFIRTGKRLPTKVTEIVVNFKKNSNVFNQDQNESNMLIFRIQPDEGLLVKFNLKKPGEKNQLLNKNLEFHYKNLSNNKLNNAYETLIMDVFNGDPMLFSRSDFVEKAWEIVDPIIESIKKENLKLYGYKAGSWGPPKADDLFRNINTWRYPCKNLVNDGEVCEL